MALRSGTPTFERTLANYGLELWHYSTPEPNNLMMANVLYQFQFSAFGHQASLSASSFGDALLGLTASPFCKNVCVCSNSFVQILLGNLWRAIQFTSLICTSERLLPLFLSHIRRRWSIASTQNVCIVPITHGLPLGFIKLRSISSPLTLTDQSVTLLGGTIALGLKVTTNGLWLTMD
jgi:hypothetical protein